jgi:hypothetical protein
MEWVEQMDLRYHQESLIHAIGMNFVTLSPIRALFMK